mmetsp:Transcript_735/g.2392  ORF Transcript_735/g.2392 Transcript_735/m.2392 type:complete len:429 (-) Transcript_735:28-1314(-)
MTSDDTHELTLKLLEENGYFGAKRGQVHLLKQEKVPCLVDNSARLDVRGYSVVTKPHGHGDVHALLHRSGLLRRWLGAGMRRVVFFQDTNALVFRVIPAALGISADRKLHFNSIAVPRKAKEAIGGIAKLAHPDGREMTVNVEYNQLDPLLRASGHTAGDVNDPKTGFSPFPGNINQLVVDLVEYEAQLRRTGGKVVEFVNPKYADEARTTFKSSTRLECMMQDYPQSLPKGAAVGFSVFDNWAGYTPVKNSPKDARAKVAAGSPSHSATAGEFDVYRCGCKLLELAGATVEVGAKASYNGIEVEGWPMVVLSPDFATCLADVRSKVKGDSVKVTGRSTLIIEGEGVQIDHLELDGALHIKAAKGVRVHIKSLKVKNKGLRLAPVGEESKEHPEMYRLRGFRPERVEMAEIHREEPGVYDIVYDDTKK